MSEEAGNRLSRWSRRKLAAHRGEAVEEEDIRRKEERQAPTATEPASATTPAAAGKDVPVLPPIEELTRDSDYTVFLAKNVPEALRRAALRKLWNSDPVFANLDGLNDYCEDLNAVDTRITLAQTAYRVGKGYFDDIAEEVQNTEASAGSRDTTDSPTAAAVPDAQNAKAVAYAATNEHLPRDKETAAPQHVGEHRADSDCDGS